MKRRRPIRKIFYKEKSTPNWSKSPWTKERVLRAPCISSMSHLLVSISRHSTSP